MIKVGFIGCGDISKKHMQTIGEIDDLKLIAVSDLHYEKMVATIDEYQAITKSNERVAMYKDYMNLLLDPRVDLVIIATISGLHAKMAKQALRNQKHVIVEKPLALSLQQSSELIQLAKKYDKHLFVCHQLRYRPLIYRLKQLVEENAFGELYYGVISLRLNRSEHYYLERDWRGTWEQDGGMLINQGIHLIDLLIWLLGDVERVYGEIMTPLFQKETEDIAIGMVTFERGIKGLIEANTITQPENVGYYLSLFGEKGTIIIGGKGFDQVEHCYIDGNSKLENELQSTASERHEHLLMYQDFVKAIKNKDHNPMVTATDGQKALELIFSLYESARTNEVVYFPIDQFSTEQMLVQNLQAKDGKERLDD